MNDSTRPPYIEVECEVCNIWYRRDLLDLKFVLLSNSDHVFLTNCCQCGTKRVVIISAYPETIEGQVTELRYPLIELGDISHLERDAFMREVKEKVVNHMNSYSETSPATMRLSDFFSQAEIDQGQVAERKKISADGPLPLALATFEWTSALGGCGGPWLWEISKEGQL